jgi:hypothetical protein
MTIRVEWAASMPVRCTCVRDARPEGRDTAAPHRGGETHRQPARRGPGAVGHSRIVPYGARSPVWRLSAKHARIT